MGDYSGSKADPLVAYRFDGEHEIENSHFVTSD
jgi:hypothetical protein